MALIDAGAVLRRVAVWMDDPSQSVFTEDYMTPFMDQAWADITTDLIALGLQFEEATAVLPAVPANTSSLRVFMQAGGPLSAMMSPRDVEWKPSGADVQLWAEVDAAAELADVPAANAICGEYTWSGGVLAVTPCAVPIDLRVRFNAMSTTLVDPSSQIIVGIGNVLAYRTAEALWMVTGGDGGRMQANMKMKGDEAFDSFASMAVQRSQGIRRRLQPTHPRRGGWGYLNRY